MTPFCSLFYFFK